MIYLEKLGEKDISTLHQIQKSTFENLYSKYKDEGSPFIESESSLLEKIKRPNDHFYFIKKNEQIIGYIRTATNDSQTKAKIGRFCCKVLKIKSVFVLFLHFKLEFPIIS